ncbi:RNA-binding protein [Echinicola soli]|uniref:RNA-binding protein n=1 Tax=Echinicola soli TaxID=2591634 RepID=A0A514CD73_9BACT|nr:VCBS repeat-containing protein [Echinicola soli]QDH77766.1 RNA-binding protein [Echinicola soli]
MLKRYPQLVCLGLLCGMLINCSQPEESTAPDIPPLFTLLSSSHTQVSFKNQLTEGLNTNVLMYEYFYNGGGVAIGDVNGDGLDDIYFTGNMIANKLYLNKGQMTFEDITTGSGTAGRNSPWKTGVTMADVNGDGKLDIYVCYSGNLRPEKRKNELYINEGNEDNGHPKFSEQAEKFGIASSSTSTQGIFFDYDKDGDLDLFLLNHNHKSLPILDEASTTAIMKEKDPAGSQLFKNDKGTFTEVTEAAGIQNSALSYGLGAGAADINGDGWTDLYICNDYTAPDYLYINNQDGTFTDRIGNSMGHTSHFSMGNDVADVNNDGLPDLFTLDMLPEGNERQKLLMAPDNYEKFDFKVNMGFHHQYMRNMLQVNNGNSTFSEIGQLSGISNTDWSWSAQFADFDNDGWKDLYITNGYLRDYTNMDFLKFMGDYVQNNDGNIRRQNVLELVKQIPSSNLHNYMFKNNGDLTFDKVSKSWGLDYLSNSNGAAYADLDNDGDLDLVVNNINLEAFIFENQANMQLSNSYLKIKLNGEKSNKFGLGTKVTLYDEGKTLFQEQMPARGYQSSVSPVLHFGLGETEFIDSLQVKWLGGKALTVRNIATNQLITLNESEAETLDLDKEPPAPLFKETNAPFTVKLTQNQLNDFKRQPLIVNPLSFESPSLAKADVNGDGLEDIFVGAGSGDISKVFIQQKNGQFITKGEDEFALDKESEDSYAEFADVNADGFPDLYVCSGGYGNFMPADTKLQDRLYLNDGNGNFKKQSPSLPEMLTSTSCVTFLDINGDQAPDIFVGGRTVPGKYPEIPRSYLLVNDGKGNFTDQTATVAPALVNPGMITDSALADLNMDGKPELLTVGEWMPVQVFTVGKGKLEEVTNQYFDKEYSGWWNAIHIDDLNGDQKPDLVLGNQGTNAQIHASDDEPASLIYKDFDQNGSLDPILCCYIQGENYPYVTRDELLDQMAKMRTRFPDYKSYASAKIEDIFTNEELKNSKTLTANHLATALFLSTASQKLSLANLPIQAQNSPVMAIASGDMDNDGNKDILLCGNIENARLRFGKYDANYGLLLKGDGKGNFIDLSQARSGFSLKGDVRSILSLQEKWIFGINQEGIVTYAKTNNTN